MSNRKHNFCAGPCTLPVSVLEEMRDEFLDYQGAGLSLIEMSHRAAEYDAVHQEARRLALEVFRAPDDFDVLFVQGGAILQFAMVAMNLLQPDQRAGYVDTGAWAKGAIADARHYGEIYTAWDGAADGYTRTPDDSEIEVRDGTRYLHVTSNETIGGIRFPNFPVVDVPLVADMSSELMARSIPWERFDLVYGGVQKNLGPAGMAMVFIRKSAVAPASESIARYLRYDVHLAKESLFNTPPMFTIAMVGKVLKWMKAKGGLDVIEREAAEKAAILYRLIDEQRRLLLLPRAPRLPVPHERGLPAAERGAGGPIPGRREVRGSCSTSRVIAAWGGAGRASTTRCRAPASRRSPTSCSGSAPSTGDRIGARRPWRSSIHSRDISSRPSGPAPSSRRPTTP